MRQVEEFGFMMIRVGLGGGDDYATHQFDDFNCFSPQLLIYLLFFFLLGMKMSFASVTWQIFTNSGKDNVGWGDMGVLCYEEPSIWSLVLYGFFCCYGWPQTNEHAAVFACLFMWSKTLYWSYKDKMTEFLKQSPVTRHLTVFVLPKGGSKPDCAFMLT